MHSWELAKDRGKSYLSRHRPQMALRFFEQGVRECPVEENRALASLLYYCGIALKKMGAQEDALECWNNSGILDPQSPAREMVNRHLEPGLPEERRHLQEWYSFKAVQVSRYFSQKAAARFETLEEHRRVKEILRGYWEEIVASRVLEGLNDNEKMALFREIRIDFSSLMTVQPCCGEDNIIPFRRQ